jgi:Colicin E5 ribonuclease domain
MLIRYANETKLRAQMAKRGWTEEQIIEALQTAGVATHGKKGPATRYIHPRTGRSVVVDDATGEVIHVGGDGFEYPD